MVLFQMALGRKGAVVVPEMKCWGASAVKVLTMSDAKALTDSPYRIG